MIHERDLNPNPNSIALTSTQTTYVRITLCTPDKWLRMLLGGYKSAWRARKTPRVDFLKCFGALRPSLAPVKSFSKRWARAVGNFSKNVKVTTLMFFPFTATPPFTTLNHHYTLALSRYNNYPWKAVLLGKKLFSVSILFIHHLQTHINKTG